MILKPPLSKLSSYVRLWQSKRIYVLGDVMLDRFVQGTVHRISPEAPIPVLLFSSDSVMLGGAGNVARNLVALGGEVVLAGVIGDDEAGRIIAQTLADEPGYKSHIRRTDQPTTVKTRFASAGQQIMRLDVERRGRLPDVLFEEIFQDFEKIADTIDVVVMSDYAKGVLQPSIVKRVIDAARARKLPVIVDPKGVDVGVYAGATLLTPNVAEASLVTRLPCSTDDEAGVAAERFRELAQASAVILTRGPAGVTISTGTAEAEGLTHIPAEAREVYDVSGAGDTVVASLALALTTGLDIPSAARIANTAAGIVVAKRGTSVVEVVELEHALDAAHGFSPKIADRDAAVSVVRRWQEQGLKVGFTNGCFDLLHPGHVELLRKSRDACDRLVVALNTDDSVRRLKGQTRPVQTETARSIVLASLVSVDLVTLFDEDTPLALIDRLRPDVLAKGADYTLSTVVGADLVQSYNGKVILVPIEEGHSTTSMIERAKIGPAR